MHVILFIPKMNHKEKKQVQAALAGNHDPQYDNWLNKVKDNKKI